jgi:hypothetical protein
MGAMRMMIENETCLLKPAGVIYPLLGLYIHFLVHVNEAIEAPLT